MTPQFHSSATVYYWQGKLKMGRLRKRPYYDDKPMHPHTLV